MQRQIQTLVDVQPDGRDRADPPAAPDTSAASAPEPDEPAIVE